MSQACQEAPNGDYNCGSVATGKFIYENKKAYLFYDNGDGDRYIQSIILTVDQEFLSVASVSYPCPVLLSLSIIFVVVGRQQIFLTTINSQHYRISM